MQSRYRNVCDINWFIGDLHLQLTCSICTSMSGQFKFVLLTQRLHESVRVNDMRRSNPAGFLLKTELFNSGILACHYLLTAFHLVGFRCPIFGISLGRQSPAGSHVSVDFLAAALAGRQLFLVPSYLRAQVLT